MTDTRYSNHPCLRRFAPSVRHAPERVSALAGMRNGSRLLDRVIAQWETGQWSPLFVSEGTNEQKLTAIRRSHYLNTVYAEVLPALGQNIVVYGWSMSAHDQHLVDAI